MQGTRRGGESWGRLAAMPQYLCRNGLQPAQRRPWTKEIVWFGQALHWKRLRGATGHQCLGCHRRICQGISRNRNGNCPHGPLFLQVICITLIFLCFWVSFSLEDGGKRLLPSVVLDLEDLGKEIGLNELFFDPFFEFLKDVSSESNFSLGHSGLFGSSLRRKRASLLGDRRSLMRSISSRRIIVLNCLFLDRIIVFWIIKTWRKWAFNSSGDRGGLSGNLGRVERHSGPAQRPGLGNPWHLLLSSSKNPRLRRRKSKRSKGE